MRHAKPISPDRALSRRSLLSGSLGLACGAALASAWLPRVAGAAADGVPALAPVLLDALASSPYVYVSPLRGDGAESRCHGEVWYDWIENSAVIITGADRWKARSLARGLDRARIWVGDFGRVKGLFGENDDFRKGPHFDARAELSRDAALLERLLSAYERKYPAEIGDWRERMRRGFHDGSRVLIRYRPAAAAAPA